MGEEDPATEQDRYLRNLQAVARHLTSDAPKGHPSGIASGAPAGGRLQALKWLGPVGVAIAFVLGKLKLLLPILKAAKLHTLLTMLLTVWVYAQAWGLPFALGFVILIFVHELGHAIVMRWQGIPAGPIVFIPFVGAFIAMKRMPRDAFVEALVGIGGPALGTAGALACLLVGWGAGSPFMCALASSGCLINLFNLIPISPLDGGRIAGVISRWLWAAGYAVGGAVFFMTRSPILFLILLLGLFSLGRTLRGPREGYFEAAPRRRLAMSAAYFALLAILALGMRAADAGASAASAAHPAGSQARLLVSDGTTIPKDHAPPGRLR